MLSNQQNLFLNTLLQLGDRSLSVKKNGLTERDLIEWMQDCDFKNEVLKIEKYFIEQLTVRISQSGLRKLDEVLTHGTKTVTCTTSITNHPEFGNIETTKNTVKHEKHSMPAIAQAVKIFIMMKIENDVLNSISNLSDRGLLPRNSEQLISSILSEAQEKTQQAMKGKYEQVGITPEMLSQIQQLVINGS